MIVYINDQKYTFAVKTSILEACRSVGIDIPTLCYSDTLQNHGRCRLCVVEVNGKLCLACETNIEDGMNISTNSDDVINMRKSVLYMLMKEHNFECPNCKKNLNCAFQNVIYQHDVNTDDHFILAKGSTPIQLTDDIIYDESKCIACGKCVKSMSDSIATNPTRIANIALNQYDVDELVDLCPTAALEKLT